MQLVVLRSRSILSLHFWVKNGVGCIFFVNLVLGSTFFSVCNESELISCQWTGPHVMNVIPKDLVTVLDFQRLRRSSFWIEMPEPFCKGLSVVSTAWPVMSIMYATSTQI
ncbi:hypothetical protein BJ508DRAFT_113954 [Ascobolus immersus RN42]|uniref:Uncharacterized protein n=1 Tax=Ascobolus immersus RN42 TaxID=1160509 RepID=A0A3N4IB57_ASCIM|nr:hypothetical protein BJ508DRAFT_113954 [Ascobolus immersus RN42]